MNNVKQFKKFCMGMSVTPPPPQLLSTTLYIYLVENWGALKVNNLIVIYDSKFFEES
jgi:hypothetical protein